MAATLGEAYVNIIPKAPGIEGQLKNMFGTAGDSAGAEAGKRSGSGLLAGIKKAIPAAAVGKILKDAFTAGGDLQQSFGGLDTIYGDASAAAKEYAQSAAQAGISANSYAEQAVSFGAALKSAYGGDTTAAIEAANTAIMDMADNSAKMGTDITNVQNAYQGFAKQNYTMLDNLKLGYGGTKSEMERLLADAQALSGVEYNIDNLGDVYNAIHVIQEDLGLTGVAAQEAATTLTGSFGAVKASWENVMAALTTGEGLDTAMANFSTSIGNFVTVALQMFGALLQQVPSLIGGLATAIMANGPSLVASGIELIANLIIGFLNGIPDFISNIPAFFDAAVSAFSAIDWASLGSDIVRGIVNGVKAAASALWSALTDLANSALNAAKSALGIASPSKVFASSVGRWIPAGMAVGIDSNAGTVDSSVNRMARSATDTFARAAAPGATATGYAPAAPSAPNAPQQPPKIVMECRGSLAQLVRLLQPYFTVEGQRLGVSYVSE